MGTICTADFGVGYMGSMINEFHVADSVKGVKVASRVQPQPAAAHINEQEPEVGEVVSLEHLVPRLGEQLVLEGVLSESDLEFALATQGRRAKLGEQVLLGQLLVELDMVSAEELDQATLRQVIQLQQTLKLSNQRLEQRVEERTRQLQNALTMLSELDQLKDDFMSTMSHELRTPLAILCGFAEMIADQSLGPLNSNQDAAMQSVLGSSKKLNQLVEEILLFTEARMGAFPLLVETVSIADLVKTAGQIVKTQARSKKIEIVIELPEKAASIKADREKITWVIGEFLENAVKFTQPGGRIWLRVTRAKKLVTVSVSDTGAGIDQERMHTIFEPFRQLENSMTRSSNGVGLGLALAKQIIEAHGSSITVHSTEGHGSQFSFSLVAFE